MIGKKINQLATELAPVSTDLTIIGDPTTGVSKKITLAQLGAIFSGAVSFYNDFASFPATGDINVIYCAKDTQKLYLWSGSAYTEVFPSQALLDTYQLRSEKGNANGYASLDSSGKVPISQLPSSIMEYKGTWNAATNTPTLANGTGDTGDVYLCNAAGTVNFGAGPLTFAVGDYVVYSGSIWQRSSGAVGTVTSVGLSITGDSIGVSNSPITTSGTLALAFAGTSSQYINGAGNLTTFPTLTGYVPYTGATANVDLGTFDLTADILTAATGSYTSSGGGNTLEISHTSGSGIALNITKGGNGEGLYINKTSGSGNAATIIGTLNATTLVKSGGTSSQFLKADGSVDSSTYLTTSAAATTYLPMVLSSTANSIEINGQFFDVASAANSYTSGRLIIAPTYGAIGYQNAGVFDGLKILTNGNAEFSNSGITRFFNQVRFDSTLTNGTYTYTLPGATGTIALTSDLTGGTVTSVGLSSATSGVTIGSTPITTSGTITLAIDTASGSQQGLLSSTDWTTFNNKQSALTNPVTGTGTTNYLPKFTGTSTIGNSAVQDDGTSVTILSRIVGINGATEAGWGLKVYENLKVQNNNGTTVLQVADTASGGKAWSLISSGTGNAHSVPAGTFYLRNSSDGLTALQVNASGNLGLGVTPSDWISVYKAINIGSQGLIYSRTDTADIAMGLNWYRNSGGAFLYNSNGHATIYAQNGGQHLFYTAPSGTAGNAISFTQAMTLNASGNLSVGNTNDTYKLDVSGTGRFGGTNTYNGFLIGSHTNNVGAAIYNKGNAQQTLYADNSATVLNAEVTLYLRTGNTDRLTIASTGAATFSSIVGINGATNSSRALQVTQTSGLSSAIRIIASSGTNALLEFLGDGGSSQPTIGVTSASPNDLQFGTGGSERMRITSGGNVGIGTTTDFGVKLAVSGNMHVTNSDARIRGGDASGRLVIGNSDTTSYITVNGSSNSNDIGVVTNSQITFTTGSGYTERMRITSGGSLLVGTTSIFASGLVCSDGGTVYTPFSARVGTTSNAGQMYFLNPNGIVGSITTSGSATSYNTSSDYRLKTDYKDFSGLDLVSKIKAYDYEWKSDKTRSYGVIAHELQSVINYAVTGVKDGEQMQGVDYSKIVPVLIKAIQELNDKIK